MNRNKEIIKTSIVGIAGNIILSVFKFIVGMISNSVSIRMDAVNNLTDVMSSVITILGTKLSEREPDSKHPFGYGRIEYVASLFIGLIILYAGIEAAKESIDRIIHPQANNYTAVAIIIVTAGVLVKIALGFFTMSRGNKLDSTALTASGKDALSDSVASGATLIAAIVYVAAGIRVEAYVGLLISGLIIKTGAQTLQETISSLLGERVDREKASAVKQCIRSFPEVDGVFDLVIHNYGMDRLVGSAHIEVPDVLTSAWIDNLQRAITAKVLEETGVEMLGITIYAVNSRDALAVEAREKVREIAGRHSEVLGMHGFYIDQVDMAIKFDIVTDFDFKDNEALQKEIICEVKKLYPEYEISVIVKKDYSD